MFQRLFSTTHTKQELHGAWYCFKSIANDSQPIIGFIRSEVTKYKSHIIEFLGRCAFKRPSTNQYLHALQNLGLYVSSCLIFNSLHILMKNYDVNENTAFERTIMISKFKPTLPFHE